MYYVYILQSKIDNFLYVGYSTDVKKRVLSHNSKKNLSTKNKAPYKLIFCEIYTCKSDAKRREKYFKTTKGKTTLRYMLKDYLKMQNIMTML